MISFDKARARSWPLLLVALAGWILEISEATQSEQPGSSFRLWSKML